MAPTQRLWTSCIRLLVLGLFAASCGAEPGFAEQGHEEDLEAIGAVSQAVTSQVIDSAWQCPSANVNCQDVFDFDVPANTTITIAVSNITGNSVLRLSAFAPGQSLNGVNMLVGSQREQRCSTVDNQGITTSIRAVVAGRYRVAVVRDFLESAGLSGNYRLSVQGSSSFTFVGQTANDVASGFTQAPGCQFAQTQNGAWSCGSTSCTDVYEFFMPTNQTVSLAVTNVTGASTLRLALTGPGSATNLLTGLNVDRKCRAQNANDTAPFLIRTAGLYRWAVGRDFDTSAGTTGTYTAVFNAQRPSTFTRQVVNDATVGTPTQCGFTFDTNSSWACGIGVNCQDVFDFETVGASPLVASVSNVTGSSVTRMALFDGNALNTVNKFNGALRDRKCATQNGPDTASSPNTPNLFRHRLAIGRDAASSEGTSGSYRLRVTTVESPVFVGGQTVNDGPSAFTTTSCP